MLGGKFRLINTKSIFRIQFVLLTLLVIINLIFRYPFTPHEIGWDTFVMHSLSNSITEFGYAKWWINYLSIYGFYPGSYASSVPFIISGISQIAELVTESSIWLFNTLLGIIGIFAAYIMAGQLDKNKFFKFFVAFLYSLSPGFLFLSTWQLSPRGLFIALLPLFIFLILKMYSAKNKVVLIKYVLLMGFMCILFVATHHIFYFLATILLSYAFVLIFYKMKKFIPLYLHKSSLLILFCTPVILFFLPFFTRLFIETGSRYDWISTIFLVYFRNAGIPLLFFIIGLVYLLTKKYKTIQESFLITNVYCLIPLVYVKLYSVWFDIIYICIFAGMCMSNILKSNLKYASLIVVVFLLLSVSFGGFYQYWNTGVESGISIIDRHISDGTYGAALWMKHYVSNDNIIVVNNPAISRRIIAISEIPTLTGDDSIDVTYGVVDIGNLNISKNSPFSINFYRDNPYVVTPGSGTTDYFIRKLNSVDIKSRWGELIISRYNISCIVEYEPVGDNLFIRSVHENKNSIYSNGKISVNI